MKTDKTNCLVKNMLNQRRKDIRSLVGGTDTNMDYKHWFHLDHQGIQKHQKSFKKCYLGQKIHFHWMMLAS